ncbi:type II toxin-antitoxin system VapC family toxin [Geodermatophilus sp. SYSU D00814]
MNLFDSSALLCFLLGEPGAEVVEAAMEQADPVCSAVNWSEVAQKIAQNGRDWGLPQGLLRSYGLRVEPVLVDDAEVAARLWRTGSGLSLADRLCLATGRRLGATVWTADTAWGATDGVRQIR